MNRQPISLGLVCCVMLTMAAQGQTVRSLNLTTNHILYEPVSGKIYATVPSSAGTHGNSIATINPVTANVARYVFIGSEPNPLAASDDGQFLYVGLDGADAIRRYDVATHTAGLQFWLGNDYFGPYKAGDLKVLPGAAHSVAVSRNFSNVAVYDDDVQRPNTVSGSMDSLAFSNSAAVLYAQDTGDSGGTFYTLAVDANGISLQNSVNNLWGGGGGPIVFDPNMRLIYDFTASAADPNSSALAGAFSQARQIYNYYGTTAGVVAGIVPDTANGRVFFLTYDGFNQGTTVTVAAFDSSTFMPIGSLVIPNVLTAGNYQSYAADLVSWGTDGLAFRTSEGQIWLISGRTFPGLADFQLSAAKVIGGATVDSTVTISRPAPPGGAVVTLNTSDYQVSLPASVTIPAGQTSASFSITTSGGQAHEVTLMATYAAQSINRSLQVVPSAGTRIYPSNVRVIHLRTNDLVFDPVDKRIYASVPSSEVGIGNSLIAIDPVTGTLASSVFVGSEPTHLAISDDGAFIYTGLNGAGAIRRFDPPTQTAELQFSLGQGSFGGSVFPGEMVVLPGQPHALAVSQFYSWLSPSFAGLPIFDDGVPRANVYSGYPGAESITAGASAGRLYGYDNESSGFELDRFNVDSNGITLLDSTNNLISGYYAEITYQGGFIFSNRGDVINAEARTRAGTFSGLGSNAAVLPDLPNNKVYFVDTDPYSQIATLRVFNPNTFLQLAAFPLPGVQGDPSSLVKWKTDNVAFRTSTGQVFLVNAALPRASSLTITPATVVGGISARGTVTLSNVAPVGGVNVSLVSSDPSVASVPTSVTVAAGKQAGSFTVKTSTVSSNTTFSITAKYKSTKSATMTVTP